MYICTGGGNQNLWHALSSQPWLIEDLLFLYAEVMRQFIGISWIHLQFLGIITLEHGCCIHSPNRAHVNYSNNPKWYSVVETKAEKYLKSVAHYLMNIHYGNIYSWLALSGNKGYISLAMSKWAVGFQNVSLELQAVRFWLFLRGRGLLLINAKKGPQDGRWIYRIVSSLWQ